MKSGVESIALRAAIAYLLIGVVDYVWQRRTLREEPEDDQAGGQGRGQAARPSARGQARDPPPQFQQARARMMAAVPQADVVVTNPTHYAVALEYDGDQPAPIVVAKGKDHVAAQIRRIAEEHGVPIVAGSAARARALPRRRGRPDDPGRPVRGRRAGAGVRLSNGCTEAGGRMNVQGNSEVSVMAETANVRCWTGSSPHRPDGRGRGRHGRDDADHPAAADADRLASSR